MRNFYREFFKKENFDIRKKVGFTLLVLVIYSIGHVITVPGVDASKISNTQGGFIDMISLLSGGGLARFSIFALGVSPYITASIIIQLLSMDVIPKLTELSKQGETGRRQINKISRILGVIFAFINGYGFALMFDSQYQILRVDAGLFDYLYIALILTAGTSFLLWLGDQITTKGIGNGMSLIIMAGIVTSLPTTFTTTFSKLVTFESAQTIFLGLSKYAIFVLAYLLLIVSVVFMQEAVRKIPIQYSNRAKHTSKQEQNYIPMKINSAGVIPVIFASSILMAPITIQAFFQGSKWMQDNTKLFTTIFDYQKSLIALILYLVLILAFTFFYAHIQIKPLELSENLQKQGGYIPGIRPGDETEKYFSRVLNRITLVGGLFLVAISAMPILLDRLALFQGTNIKLGGTGMLIVVGVSLEIYRQLQSQLMSRSYAGYKKR